MHSMSEVAHASGSRMVCTCGACHVVRRVACGEVWRGAAGKGARCEVRGADVAWCGEVARCGCGVVLQRVTCGEVWRGLDE